MPFGYLKSGRREILCCELSETVDHGKKFDQAVTLWLRGKHAKAELQVVVNIAILWDLTICAKHATKQLAQLCGLFGVWLEQAAQELWRQTIA